MEFEDMKKIWSECDKQHMYAIDEEALHKRVLRQKAGAQRRAAYFEGSLILTLSGLGTAMIVEGLLNRELYQLPEGAILLSVAGYLCWERWVRWKAEPRGDRTLLGEIEGTIRTLDGHIRRQKRFVFYFILPMVAALAIHFAYTHEGKPWWIWVFTLAAFAASYGMIQKELRGCVLPKRADLVALRDQLLEGGESERNGTES